METGSERLTGESAIVRVSCKIEPARTERMAGRFSEVMSGGLYFSDRGGGIEMGC